LRKRLNHTEELFPWIISTIILIFLSAVFWAVPTFERTFYLFIFLVPALVSLGITLYLIAEKLIKR